MRWGRGWKQGGGAAWGREYANDADYYCRRLTSCQSFYQELHVHDHEPEVLRMQKQRLRKVM